ncbi:YdcF family protein [Sporosarcina highlanderae]|uniref:YdcF family protein n=1 Tax=Sporosarcina highlanderae TaxID=3035916 RepID=A0ABT8JPC6_9BACL|nr:YdcF family protein [Sporosarcina highlanderae]MDN4606919.1 YdcF family protein [Sporosarcina highlanderae]
MKKSKKMGIAIGIVLVLFGLSLWFLTGKWIADGQEPVANGTNEYAIILGAKVNGETPSLTLHYRLEKALSYAEGHPDVRFILSGGQGPDEDIAEAEAMRRYLTEHGISEDRLLIESKSTSTYENLLFSKSLLPEEINSLTIITSDFHLARARMLADTLGLETDALGAKTPASVKVKHTIRERLAIIKTCIVGK